MIIEKLWQGEFDPIEFSGKNNPEFKLFEADMCKAFEELEACLDDKHKKSCEKYFATINRYITESAKQSFCEGFCIGARITSEALITADKLTKR